MSRTQTIPGIDVHWANNLPVHVNTVNHGMLLVRELAKDTTFATLARHLELRRFPTPSKGARAEFARRFPREVGNFPAVSFAPYDTESEHSIQIYWTLPSGSSPEAFNPTETVQAGLWIMTPLGPN